MIEVEQFKTLKFIKQCNSIDKLERISVKHQQRAIILDEVVEDIFLPVILLDAFNIIVTRSALITNAVTAILFLYIYVKVIAKIDKTIENKALERIFEVHFQKYILKKRSTKEGMEDGICSHSSNNHSNCDNS